MLFLYGMTPFLNKYLSPFKIELIIFTSSPYFTNPYIHICYFLLNFYIYPLLNIKLYYCNNINTDIFYTCNLHNYISFISPSKLKSIFGHLISFHLLLKKGN